MATKMTITYGPSKDELKAALFDFVSGNRRHTIELTLRNGVRFTAEVDKVAVADDDVWAVTGMLLDKDANREKSFTALLYTNTRKGAIEYE